MLEIFKLLGTVAIDTAAAEQNLDNVAGKAGKTESKMSSAFKKIGAGLAAAFSVKAIADFGNVCIGMASDVEEMENKFNVVFQGMTDEVNKWAEDYANAIGRNSNTIKGYLADNQNMFVGMGMGREEAAGLSEDLVSLALDLASFNNLSEDDAVNALSKAIMGESEAAKSLGAVLNDNTRQMAMEALGYEGKYDALTETQKMEVNYQAVLMQSIDAIGDCERSVDSYKGRQIQLTSTIEHLKEKIGGYLLPVMTKLTKATNDVASWFLNHLDPAIQWVSSAFMAAGSYLSGVFAPVIENVKTIFGKVKDAVQPLIDKFTAFVTSSDTVSGASNVLKDALQFVADALSAVTEWISTGIDWLVSFLTENETVQAGISVVWSEIQLYFQSAWEFIKTIWDTVSGYFSTVWENIKAVFSGEIDPDTFFTNIFKAAWEAICAIWDAVVGYFTGIWEGIVAIFSSEDGQTLISGVFDAAWSAIKTVWDFVVGFFQAVWEGITGIFGGEGGSVSISGVFDTAWQAIKGIWDGVTGFFSGIWEGIKGIFGGGGEDGESAISGVFDSAWSAVSGIWNGATEFFSGVWGGIKGVFDKASSVDISGVFDTALETVQTAWEGAKGFFSGIWDGIKGVFSGGSDDKVSETVSEPFTEASMAAQEAAESVQTAWDETPAWFGDEVIGPTTENLSSASDKFSKPFLDALESVQDAWGKLSEWFSEHVIQPIQALLDFKWEWPHIPLPHFSIQGVFSLEPPSVPSVGVDWYAKAMNNPMIMDGPTAFGINGNGQIMAGGEAGSEVVSGTDTLMGMISDAVSSQNVKLEAALTGILNLLSEYMPQMANMQLVTDTGALVGAISPMVDSSMGRTAMHRGRGN